MTLYVFEREQAPYGWSRYRNTGRFVRDSMGRKWLSFVRCHTLPDIEIDHVSRSDLEAHAKVLKDCMLDTEPFQELLKQVLRYEEQSRSECRYEIVTANPLKTWDVLSFLQLDRDSLAEGGVEIT
jgi:hypothetical protein